MFGFNKPQQEKEQKEEVKLIDHTITQEDLDENPEMAQKGLKVGDVIQIEEDEEENDNDNSNQGQGEQEADQNNASTTESITEDSGQESDEEDQEVVKKANTFDFSQYNVEFENKTIKEVRKNDPLETEELYHVAFLDGTTGHVPKAWLDKTLAELE